MTDTDKEVFPEDRLNGVKTAYGDFMVLTGIVVLLNSIGSIYRYSKNQQLEHLISQHPERLKLLDKKDAFKTLRSTKIFNRVCATLLGAEPLGAFTLDAITKKSHNIKAGSFTNRLEEAQGRADSPPSAPSHEIAFRSP